MRRWMAIAVVAACGAGAGDAPDGAVDALPVDSWQWPSDARTCGNGVVDPGEECDGTPDCNVNCRIAVEVGCADGTREGLVDVERYPLTAACAGAWDLPGVRDRGRDCQRRADGTTTGCTPLNLCTDLWFVCGSVSGLPEMPSLCTDAVAGRAGVFYASDEVTPPFPGCSSDDGSAVFGCGDVGSALPDGCAPLDRSSGPACSDLPAPWACGNRALTTLVKPGPDHGGVLCCSLVLL